MQRKTNEQEIKELEIELKKIDKILDEIRPIHDEYIRIHDALEAYCDLNIDASCIEERIQALKEEDWHTVSIGRKK